MATLRKKNGKYFIDYRINGKRLRETVSASRKEAEAVLKEVEAQVAAAKIESKLGHIKLHALVNEYLRSSKSTKTPVNLKSYEDLEKSAQYFNAIADAVIVMTPDAKVASINNAFTRIWGYTTREIVGKSIFKLFPRKELSSHIKTMEDMVRSGVMKKFETIALTKQGKKIPLIVTGSMIKDEKGKLAHIIGVFKDITQLKRTENALKEERDKVRLYFDIADVLMVVIGPDKKVERINNCGCMILGQKREDIVGKNWFTNFVPRRLKEPMTEIFDKVLSGRFKTFDSFELPVLTKSGEERTISWRHAAVKDPDGKVIGCLSSGEDVTERRNFDEQIRQFQKDLIAANKKLRELALIDPLTGLYNHRFLEKSIEAEFDRAKRMGYPLSVVMLDIDYFKSINDLYGRKFGDLVLKQFAEYLQQTFRKYDVITRLEGEKFVVISSRIDKTITMALTQRILETVNFYKFGDKQHTVQLRLSVGVSSYPEDKASKGSSLIDKTEKILHKAQSDGGNRVYDLSSIKKRSSRTMSSDTDNMQSLANKLERLTKRENQSSAEAIFAFAKTIEMKDNYTGDHVEKTVRYALKIAKKLGLPPEEIERIRQGAMLHDLGKVGISDKILLKAGKLTEQEFEEIKKHPQIAADILRPIHFLQDIIPLIYYHHEKWDGGGYPCGLAGSEIPRGARIIALADVYQALTSDRPYRKAFDTGTAIKIIQDSSGSHFDPEIVNTFIEIIQEEEEEPVPS